MSQHNRRVSRASGSGAVASRNQQSCSQCRRDKQKCLPANRDWNDKKERCERCEKLDHPCGPREKSQGRRSGLSISNARKDSTLKQILQDSNFSTESPFSHLGTTSSSPEHSPQTHGFDMTWSESIFTQVNSEYFLPNPREMIRNALARLEDVNTTREMLLEVRKYAMKVERWFNEQSIFAEMLNVLIEGVETEFQKDMMMLVDNGSGDMGPDSDIVVIAMLQSARRYTHPQIFDRREAGFAKSMAMQKLLHLSRRSRKSTETDPVRGSTREILSGDDSTYQTVLTFIDASKAIEHMLEMLEDNGQHSGARSRCQFSADQIAYIYGNNSAAVQLWSGCQDIQPSCDVLGRSLLHLVVLNSDHCMLQELLFLHSSNKERLDATDIMGVTPLQIAVCNDDVQCYSLLVKNGAGKRVVTDKHGRDLLALAAHNGSSRIVAHMLGQRAIAVSCRPILAEALASGHEETIKLVISYHETNPYTLDSVSQTEALEIARAKKLFVFAERISKLQAPQPDLHETLNDLHNHKFDDDFIAEVENTFLSMDVVETDWYGTANSDLYEAFHHEELCSFS